MILVTSKERLLQYLEYKEIDRTNFYRITGIKRGLLDADKLKASISDTTIANIIASYADLNVEWLINGRGKMLKTPNTLQDADALRRLRVIRFETGLTVKDFADKINIDSQYYELIEKGEYEIDDFLFRNICHIFNTNAEWLLTGRGEMFAKMGSNDVPAENNSDFITIPREAWEIIRDQAASLNAKDKQTADVIAMLKDQVKKGEDVGDYTHVATRAVGE